MSRHTKKHRYQSVLALDAHYMPMVELSRRKALKAVASGRAHVLNLQTWTPVCLVDAVGQPIHAVVFPKAKAVAEVKLGCGRGTQAILKRDGYRCQYDDCTRRGVTVDHIVPRCQGGESTWTNQVACCPSCNSRKGGRTPEQAGMRLKAPVKSPRAILMDRLHSLTQN